MALRLCRNGPQAMKETKRLLAALEGRPGHQHEEQTVETIARVRVGLEAQEGSRPSSTNAPNLAPPFQGRSMTQYHPIKRLLIANCGQYNGSVDQHASHLCALNNREAA